MILNNTENNITIKITEQMDISKTNERSVKNDPTTTPPQTQSIIMDYSKKLAMN